jgi:predicted membrane-bound spermidine synthase
LNPRLLAFVVAVSGASVLAVEIVGTRLLGPFYGVSLFLWSALIGVTLAALALGYALGGRWADRGPTPARLALLLAAAGAWLLVVPFVVKPVLETGERLGLRTSVLVSAALLFFPPLFLLGMVSPYAIRLRARALDEVGRVAGDLYAISTVASVVGAIATGFWLVPWLGTRGLVLGTGALLVLVGGIVLLAAGGRTRAAGLALAIVGTGGLLLGLPRARATLDAGSEPVVTGNPPLPTRVVEIVESPYAEIRVVERGAERFLLLDGGAHTIVRIEDGQAKHPYVIVTDLARDLFDREGTLLLLGLGGGAVAEAWARRGWKVTAVEIDSAVTEIARRHFGLRPYHADVHHGDARRFLRTTQGRYDVIVYDAYGSGAIPFHLVTAENFAEAKARLAPGGVVALNVEAHGWHHPIVHSLASTLRTQFAHVIALPIVEPPDRLGNLVLLASDRALAIPDSALGDPVQALVDPYEHWKVVLRNHAWDNRFEPAASPLAPVLTDERNRVDLWAEEINRAARRELHELFGDAAIAG